MALPKPDDYQHHKKSILGALEKQRTAQSMYRKALQTAQAAGIDTDAMLEANRITRKNDPKATANSLNQLAFALQQEGFPIHITVHDTLAGDQLEQIYRRYFKDGADGKPLDNRYPEGSDLHAQAARAWRHGTSSNMGMTPEQSDAAVAEDMTDVEKALPPPPALNGAQPVGAMTH